MNIMGSKYLRRLSAALGRWSHGSAIKKKKEKNKSVKEKLNTCENKHGDTKKENR